MSSAGREFTLKYLTLILLAVVAGCDAPVANIRPVGSPPMRGTLGHEDLDATLWMQTSAEYAAITEMVYDVAWRHVESALRDKDYAAWPPQASMLASPRQDAASPRDDQSRPPAVILDVDETVLDNSAFQAQLIVKNGEYDLGLWKAFCQRAESLAVPGAVQFVSRCGNAGVEVFFVTNRDVDEKSATCRNLSKLDMLPADDQQHVQCKGERPEWTSDKEPRRKQLAESYRVLALIGDDLNDFVSVGYKATASDRRQLATDYAPMWGQGWFMLPNANYGGWERAIYDWNDAMPRPQKLRRKLDSMRRPESGLKIESRDTSHEAARS